VQRNRLNTDCARTDTRDWAKARRERTRHLIELGGLVHKAGLVELVDDDRATLLGAFLEIAGWLQEDEHQEKATNLKTRWRRLGLRAFDADAAVAASGDQGRSGAADDDRPLSLENEGQPERKVPQ